MGSVCIMAGGTGGHIFPGLALASALQAHQVKVIWLGSKQGMEQTLVPKAGIPLHGISVSGLRSKGLLGWFKAPWMLAKAMVQAWHILRAHRPDCVVGLGGFASGPGGLAARLLGIPLIIHEQNSVAGLTNRCLARVAQVVLGGFPCALPRLRVIGNPVRTQLTDLPMPALRYAKREGALRLLVLGGSQGARRLNQIVAETFKAYPALAEGYCVWQQTGATLYNDAQQAWQDAATTPWQLVPFIDDMAAAYTWADVVICRSGALTIAELAAVGVASILVPFPHAVDDHQTANARYLVDGGAALLLPETTLSCAQLADCLMSMTRQNLQVYASAARQLAQPQVAEQLADACFQFIPAKAIGSHDVVIK